MDSSATIVEACRPRACAPQQEKSLQWEARTQQWRVAATSCNYRKPPSWWHWEPGGGDVETGLCLTRGVWWLGRAQTVIRDFTLSGGALPNGGSPIQQELRGMWAGSNGWGVWGRGTCSPPTHGLTCLTAIEWRLHSRSKKNSIIDAGQLFFWDLSSTKW